MALVKCPECKKEISDSADSCPHCGYKLKNTKKESSSNFNFTKDDSNVLLIVAVICLFAVPFVGVILLIVALSQKKKAKKAKERSDMEKILIKNAKIDALASIDPTNTEKAKEQIDIINKLDNLD
ncbi:MAG: zinc ribbon domain-containing protein [Firmicutes bacterium]|nr:zinc ribbon domain-containing protein [Candidatus Fiminaster equi]